MRILARDAYSAWRTLVRQGNSSVIVYTPFLDRLVVRLFEQCSELPPVRAVVTDLSPRSGALDYPKQLIALKSLVDSGVDVRSLPRLHAKVLWVDHRMIAIGSQNFTTYARRSKEVTSIPMQPLADSKFETTLEQWLAESTPVTADLLDLLLAGLKQPWAAQAKAADVVADAYEDIVAKYDAEVRARREAEEREEARLDAVRLAASFRWDPSWFDTVTRRSTLRLAQTTAWASMKRVGSYTSGYSSLVVDPEYNLNEWIRRSGGGQETVQLNRLMMYPMMIAETGRMGFARVAKSRISYVRTSVIGGLSQRMDSHQTKVTIRFPASLLERRNIEIAFELERYPAVNYRAEALFDGEAFHVITPDEGTTEHWFAKLCYEFISTRKTQKTFIADAFGAFRYGKGLNRDRHDIPDFFDGSRYRISLVECESTPFFLASRVR